MNRLFRNQGGYCGETIRIGDVIESVDARAAADGWLKTELCLAGRHPVWAMERAPAVQQPDTPRLYLSAGIHGDEPAGPLAMARLLQPGTLSSDIHWFVCPCLNPAGFDRNCRTDAEGVDLNRDYREPQTALVRAHVRWLESVPRFDAALLLHEDWEADGFYLYELCREPARPLSESVVEGVAQICPMLESKQIDGWPARHGVVRPDVDPMERPQWPEALHLFMRKSSLCYTFEAPSDYPLELRTKALQTAVGVAINAFRRHRTS